MTDEIFDIVDSQDLVTGTAPRAVVHAKRLLHRAAHVLAFDAAGRLYLQRRAFTKECSPGLWDTSAAGHLASGEDYATAARRELEEELGVLPVGELTFLFKLPASEATGQEFVEIFRAEVTSDVRPDPVEIMDGRWCTTAEVTAWLAQAPAEFTGTFRLIWARLGETPSRAFTALR